MKKKITAVTLTAIMMLTLFTAMVPAASCAVEVEAPYEFMGAVGNIPGWINLTSHNNSGILFYDIDEKDGDETLNMYIDTNLDIDADNFTYTTTIYETDEGDANVAWLGAAYYVVSNDTSEWWISKKLIDEDEDDEYLLRVGESLSLPEGMSLTALEIDVDGEEAWLTLSKDGEELGSEVVSTDGDNPYFIFEADLDDDGEEDNEVINLTIETVFAGMNTNLVKFNDIDLISMDVLLIEDGDTDMFSDFEIDLGTDPTLTIQLEDSDDEISLTSDGVKDILGDRISVRVNDEDDFAAVVTTITEPGTYELTGAVGDIPGWINLTSALNPSLLYYDIDEKDGDETLDMYIDTNLDIDADNFTYTTTIYETDEGDANVAWLGAAYYVVSNDTSEWWISKKLIDEDEDDEYLLRVGESLSLPEGMSLTALEIDVDGEEAWLTLSKDGEELGSEVVSTDGDNPYFIFEADLDDDGEEDNEVINLTIETVFAGMNTNLVKFNDIDLISMDVLLIEDGDTDMFSDFEIDLGTDPTLTIQLEDSDDEISLTSDGVKDVFGDSISIRVNENDDYAAVVKKVIVGGGAVKPTPTDEVTPEPTDTEPIGNETPTDGGPPTAGPTEDTGVVETPTEEPTKSSVPGFEGVFAVAGLLAVAYLVLRQRE